MKQITFSNVVAVVAILLCFYAFAEDKKSSGTVEMEYCIMKFYPGGLKNVVGTNPIFSDGRFVHDMTILPDDPTFLKTINIQINKLIADGWVLKQHSLESTSYTEQFIFERVK